MKSYELVLCKKWGFSAIKTLLFRNSKKIEKPIFLIHHRTYMPNLSKIEPLRNAVVSFEVLGQTIHAITTLLSDSRSSCLRPLRGDPVLWLRSMPILRLRHTRGYLSCVFTTRILFSPTTNNILFLCPRQDAQRRWV